MKTTNQSLNAYNHSISGRRSYGRSNSILVINPYYHAGSWVFDDERVGLTKEPFVAGADLFIEYVLSKKGKLEEGKNGFSLVFSLIPFLGFEYELNFVGHESMGSLYTVNNNQDFKGVQGHNLLWLCPALNLYFSNSPQKIYVSVQL